jgi:hypothetical protein
MPQLPEGYRWCIKTPLVGPWSRLYIQERDRLGWRNGPWTALFGKHYIPGNLDAVAANPSTWHRQGENTLAYHAGYVLWKNPALSSAYGKYNYN